MDYRSYGLPVVHQVEGRVDVLKAHRVSDEGAKRVAPFVAPSVMPGSWLRTLTPPPCPTHYTLERPRRISCPAPATPMMTDSPIRVRMTLTLPMPSKAMVDLIATAAGLVRLGSGGP